MALVPVAELPPRYKDPRRIRCDIRLRPGPVNQILDTQGISDSREKARPAVAKPNLETVIEHLGVDGINSDSNNANKGHTRGHVAGPATTKAFWLRGIANITQDLTQNTSFDNGNRQGAAERTPIYDRP